MPVKNFLFRENWVDTQVAGMKTTFFTIFDPTWTHILFPNGQNKEFLKQHFNFQSIRKREAILLPFLVILTLTNYSKIFESGQFFAIFDTNWDKNVALTSFKCGISSYIGLIFPLRYLYIHCVLLL